VPPLDTTGDVAVTAVIVPLPLPHGDPASASVAIVSLNFTQSLVVELVGPVVMPAPLPARAFEDVTVVAVAAMGTCPAVMPLTPEVVRLPDAVPVRLAVIVPALKLPLPSRSTTVEAVFAVAYAIDDVTVVAEAATGNWPAVMPDIPLVVR
jgi:hypothetical protein